MAEIDGGSLSFKSVMDNDQLNSAIDETLRRVQGFSDAVVGSGDVMDKTTQEMIVQVRSALGQIGDACVEHEQALDRLGQEYDRLGNEMERAFTSGRDDEFRALQEQRNAIQGEMTVRKQLLKELREQSNALEDEATKLEEAARQAEQTAQAHVSLRTRIRDLKEEMAAMIADGIDEQSAAYKELEAELGRLMDIQGDIQAQGTVLANDDSRIVGCRWWFHSRPRCGVVVCRGKRKLAKDNVESSIPDVNYNGIATSRTNLEQGFGVSACNP